MKKGWEAKKLGDVSALLNRGVSPIYIDQDGVRVLNQKCIRNHSITYEQSRRHDSSSKPVSPERFIRLGDVLVNSTGTGTLGRVAQVHEMPNEPTTVDSHVTIVRPKDGMFYNEFFGYMLILIEEAIKEAGEGCGGQTELARSVLAEKFIVHYPVLLPEQQRIVAILDESFAAIAKAKENAEKNIANAREVFETYLRLAFAYKSNGKTSVPLIDLCEFIVDCEHKTAPTQETGYPSIRTPNVGKGVLILDDVNRVSEKTYLEWTRRAIPHAGDLILAREAPAGNVAVIPENIEVCLGQRTVLIRPIMEKLNSKYLAFLLLSKDVQEILLSNSRGATVTHINMKDIRAFKIYDLLPLPVQNSIVTKLDALEIETKQLASLYSQKVADLDELKKSILEKAFAGELNTNCHE